MRSGGGSSGGPGAGGNRRDKSDDGYRVNREIRAEEVRVIDEAGAMLGVFPSRDAIKLAEERGLDLIEIAPNASPPTCKIMDYGKWKYENKKKQVLAKKNQTVITVKEVQLRPRTDQHDIDTKLRHARRFLLEGDKVKINCRFMGREMAHQEHGVELLKKFAAALNDISALESSPKMEGKQMFALLNPDPVKIKDYLKANPQMAQSSAAEKAELAAQAKAEAKAESKPPAKS
jgi:translation initiation factor IF-3